MSQSGLPEHILSVFRYDSENDVFFQKSVQRELRAHEVLIRTTHASLCYTDVHAKHRGIGLGHEGVGIVERVGEAVKSLHVGQRAGWGWLHSSCGYCSTCGEGYRQYCASASGFAYSDLEQGAFGDSRIIDAEFAYAIPDEIPSEHAAPFMCAGASVYEALDAGSVKPSDRVGVVGLGGLGSMLILFAKAQGCAVTAISATGGNEDKIRSAFELGADEFRTATEADTRVRVDAASGEIVREEAQAEGINVLVICSNEVPDLKTIFPLLARRAVIVLMSISTKPLVVPYMDFILPGHKIIASTEASRRNHIDMLTFAARHKIVPPIEKFQMTAEGLKAAFDRLESGKMRYRGVLEVPTN